MAGVINVIGKEAVAGGLEVENVKDVNNYILRIDEMLERKRVGIQKYLNG